MTSKANNMAAELEAFFAAREMATAPAWRPEPGETLIGAVIGLRMGESRGAWVKGDEDRPYPIVIYRRENPDGSQGDTVAFHAFHTLARQGLKDVGCKIGMRNAISYLGEFVTNDSKELAEKDQTTYHNYFIVDLDAINVVEPVEKGFSFD